MLAASKVGALIEEIDIDDLEKAILETDESALDEAYGSLIRASYRHLRAFVQSIDALEDGDYKAQYLEQPEVDASILN